MMQPFFISTRATMMSCPTTNCRCNSGFKSSKSIEDQGTYFNSIFLAGLFFALVGWAVLRLTVLRRVIFAWLCFWAVDFAFAISVHPAFIDCNCIVVQVAMRQLQGLRFAHFTFGNHLGQGRSQRSARRLDSQPVAFFRSQGLVVRKRVGAKGDFIGKSLQPSFKHMPELRGIHIQ